MGLRRVKIFDELFGYTQNVGGEAGRSWVKSFGWMYARPFVDVLGRACQAWHTSASLAPVIDTNNSPIELRVSPMLI